MTFTSLSFLLFLTVVVIVNACLPIKYRYLWILAASYYFYINWQPIYALLLTLTSATTYLASLWMSKPGISKKLRLGICIAGCLVPLLSLVLFKYADFITKSVEHFLILFKIHLPLPALNLLLPIGISFYTFTVVGYLIDVYKNKYLPERNFGIVCLFIAFFAQITSGPIPRGDSLIPQLKHPHKIDYDNIIGGLRTLLWGFFMKLCVADRLGIYVDSVFNNMIQHNGSSLFLASLLYSIQIYCDFAGYSLMAIGSAKMLGIDLINNFQRPYFAKNFKEFWSRWHISLSTWFRDYVYIPLGGNRVSKSRNAFNLIVTFLVSGLWHGAAWNFLLWGGLHGVGQTIEKQMPKRKILPAGVKIVAFFMIINFLWVFFRLHSTNDLSYFFTNLVTNIGFPFIDMTLVYGLLSFLLLFLKDLVDEYWPHIKLMNSPNFFISNIATGILAAVIILFGIFDNSSFIYFQF